MCEVIGQWDRASADWRACERVLPTTSRLTPRELRNRWPSGAAPVNQSVRIGHAAIVPYECARIRLTARDATQPVCLRFTSPPKASAIQHKSAPTTAAVAAETKVNRVAAHI